MSYLMTLIHSYLMTLIHHHGHPERTEIGNRRAVQVE
jgi:hypothetical protein